MQKNIANNEAIIFTKELIFSEKNSVKLIFHVMIISIKM